MSFMSYFERGTKYPMIKKVSQVITYGSLVKLQQPGSNKW